MTHFLSQKVLAATETEAYVEFRKLESALSFDLAEETPNPREDENCIREDDEEEEEPFPFIRHLVYSVRENLQSFIGSKRELVESREERKNIPE